MLNRGIRLSPTVINFALEQSGENYSSEDWLSCHAFKLGISSEQDAKPAAWLRLTHYKDCAIIDIKV
jgi:hypothetical protein